MDTIAKNPREDGLGYNPRCLRRDVNKNPAFYTTANWTYDLIANSDTIADFQAVMTGRNAPGGFGVHTAGHYTVGGDPGGDLYAGPGDPAFFLHHAMIDRVWWIWQIHDLSTRLTAISGTITMKDNPPSRNATLDDDTDFGLLGPSVKLGDLLATMGGHGGKFCYVYDQ
jgi:tyrosinase